MGHWGQLAVSFVQEAGPRDGSFMDLNKHPAMMPVLYAWAANCYEGASNVTFDLFLSLFNPSLEPLGNIFLH